MWLQLFCQDDLWLWCWTVEFGTMGVSGYQTQAVITWSKLTIETLEQCVKYVQN